MSGLRTRVARLEESAVSADGELCVGCAIKAGAEYAVAAGNRTSVYENRRDDDRVIQEVNQTLKSTAAPAVASYNRANMFYGTREFDKAIQYYNQAIKLQPDNAEALNQRCGARAAVGALKM